MFIFPIASGLSIMLLTLTACSGPLFAPIHSQGSCPAGGIATEPCNVVHGISANRICEKVIGGVIGGGGNRTFPNLTEGNYGVVAGGLGNQAAGESVVAGGSFNLANGFRTAIGGGAHNATSNSHSTVGGGTDNAALGINSTVGGGGNNLAAQLDSTIGGGSGNLADGMAATISGGSQNSAKAYATVGAGLRNFAGGGFSTVSGGVENEAIGLNSTVGGGAGNQAAGNSSLVGGGLSNIVFGDYSTVGGGRGNSAGGVDDSSQSGHYSTVGGGRDNAAEGIAATVPGGSNNQANGNYSFAAGRGAQILNTHGGSFVFADSNDAVFSSQASNEFSVRATGGVRFVTAIDNGGAPISGVMLPGGSGSWSFLSGAAFKTNIEPVDSHELMENLAKLPIYTWSYAAQEPSTRHMGPLSEDFFAAFGLGENDQYISAIDLLGVSLASARVINEGWKTDRVRIELLELDIQQLETRLAALEQEAVADRADGSTDWDLTTSATWLLLGLASGILVAWPFRARVQKTNE